MCWSCNPICGGCRPPRIRAVQCPECDGFNACDIEHLQDSYECEICEADITDLAIPEPAICKMCGEICYNPCKRSRKELEDGELIPCQMRVVEPLIPGLKETPTAA